MKEALKREASAEQTTEGLVRRQRGWVREMQARLAPQLKGDRLKVLAVNVGVELTEALDQNHPMAHVRAHNPFEFLVMQVPSLIVWLNRWRRSRKEKKKADK